jgi:hypothetical protein
MKNKIKKFLRMLRARKNVCAFEEKSVARAGLYKIAIQRQQEFKTLQAVINGLKPLISKRKRKLKGGVK